MWKSVLFVYVSHILNGPETLHSKATETGLLGLSHCYYAIFSKICQFEGFSVFK